MKQRQEIDQHGERWLLVETYVAPCGFVEHWISWDNPDRHRFEPINPQFKQGLRAVFYELPRDWSTTKKPGL